MRGLFLFLFCALVFGARGTASGENSENYTVCPAIGGTRISAELTDEDAILGLADRLYEEKDFLRAAGEYLRFYSLFPDSQRAQDALFRAGLSYMEAGLWLKASAQFEKLEKDFPGSPVLPHALYLQGHCLKRAGRFEDARSVWSRTAEKYPDSQWGQRSGIERALSRGEQGDYGGALQDLMEVGPGNRFRDSARLMARELEDMDQIPRKSPLAAGILSAFLPGAGQFYLGRFRHGSVALILNALTTWGAFEALENDDDGLAVILLAVEAIWYSASIVGAFGAAHKMNRQMERDYFRELEQRYFFQGRNEPREQGVRLGLRLDF
ncbi:MAG: tetratricopeptide repeat protein [Deltaproteobacteria bacterium]|nr:tetratricopeptide repeat protein [Deltaproteobacteria bacterium]